jgi:hypothetical protein
LVVSLPDRIVVMPRHARFMLAETPIHVIQRGHNRAACFFDPAVIDAIRLAPDGGYVLGNTRFQDEIAGMLGPRVVRGKAGRPVKLVDGPAMVGEGD